MKKLVLLFAATAMLISCGKEGAIKDKVVAELKADMKDPGSFELLDYKSEEVTFKEAKQFLPTTQLLIESLSGDAKANFQKEHDFVSAGKDDNAIACYKINMRVKANNSFGQPLESNYEAEVLNNETQDIIFIDRK